MAEPGARVEWSSALPPREGRDALLERVRAAVERHGARAVLSLPPGVIRRLNGRAIEIDGNRLDPQAQLVLALANRIGPPPAEKRPLELARRDLERNARVLDVEPPPLASVTERAIDAGAATVRVRVYRPAVAPAPRAALVYFHGGGFVLGGLDSHDGVCRFLAHHGRCVVASVDYRLAPEHPFPAALDDALGAFRWAREHAAELGVEPSRIAVGGDSAGGNLSAVVAQQLAPRGEGPSFQLLIYPATDMRRATASHKLFANGFLLEERTIDWFLSQYLAGHDEHDPRVSPLLATSLAGQPPAMVVTAGFDPVRDEGRAYAARLREAGVRVEHREDRGMFHGYFGCGGALTVAREALDDAARALREWA